MHPQPRTVNQKNPTNELYTSNSLLILLGMYISIDDIFSNMESNGIIFQSWDTLITSVAFGDIFIVCFTMNSMLVDGDSLDCMPCFWAGDVPRIQ